METQSEHSNKYYYLVVAGAFVLMISVALGTVCLSFFVKPVTDDLGFERGAFTLYYSIIFLVGIIVTPFMGKYIQKHGARQIVIAGSLVGGLAFFLFSRAQTLLAFYAVAALLGLFFISSTFLAGSIAINTWFVKKRGFMLGLAMSSSGLGTAIFSYILPPFITRHGWQRGYLLLAICWVALTLPAGLLLIKRPPEYYGMKAYGDNSRQGQSETNERQGLTYAEALKSPSLYLFMISFLFISIIISNLQHLPSYFAAEGLTELQFGSLMSVLSIVLIFVKIASGALADRVGITRSYLLFLIAGLIAYTVLLSTSRFEILFISIFFMAIYNASISIMPSLTTIRLFGQKEFSAIWGVVSMAGALGQVIGTPVWGLVYDKTGTYRPAFMLVPFVMTVSFIFVFIALKKTKKPS